MRSISDFSEENTEVVDWLADDAVLCELLSADLQPVDAHTAVDRAAVDTLAAIGGAEIDAQRINSNAVMDNTSDESRERLI